MFTITFLHEKSCQYEKIISISKHQVVHIKHIHYLYVQGSLRRAVNKKKLFDLSLELQAESHRWGNWKGFQIGRE